MHARVNYHGRLLMLSLLLFCSCGQNGDQKQNDSLSGDSFSVDEPAQDSIPATVVNETPAAYKLSPEDSMRVADSVAVNRNPVRDFD